MPERIRLRVGTFSYVAPSSLEENTPVIFCLYVFCPRLLMTFGVPVAGGARRNDARALISRWHLEKSQRFWCCRRSIRVSEDSHDLLPQLVKATVRAAV